MKRWGWLILAVGLGACAGPLEEVEVVVVQCEIRGGAPDCVTVVEFPDETRRVRGGQWGDVGDVFMARKGAQSRNVWTS